MAKRLRVEQFRLLSVGLPFDHLDDLDDHSLILIEALQCLDLLPSADTEAEPALKRALRLIESTKEEIRCPKDKPIEVLVELEQTLLFERVLPVEDRIDRAANFFEGTAAGQRQWVALFVFHDELLSPFRGALDGDEAGSHS